jgi:hypothetical protein
MQLTEGLGSYQGDTSDFGAFLRHAHSHAYVARFSLAQKEAQRTGITRVFPRWMDWVTMSLKQCKRRLQPD